MAIQGSLSHSTHGRAYGSWILNPAHAQLTHHPLFHGVAPVVSPLLLLLLLLLLMLLPFLLMLQLVDGERGGVHMDGVPAGGAESEQGGWVVCEPHARFQRAWQAHLARTQRSPPHDLIPLLKGELPPEVYALHHAPIFRQLQSE